MDLDRTLALLALDPAHPVDVALVALHLARDEYPDLDIPAYVSQFEAYADAIAPRLSGSLALRAATFTHFLFVEEGFRGNHDDYYDPRNSYLNEVLDRKRGLPITLAILAAAIGERAGLTVQGLALPGHFMAIVAEEDEAIIFDPFHAGRTLDIEEAERVVTTAIGQPFTLTSNDLRAAEPGTIVTRMLNNLKGVYLKQGEFRRAARVIRRLLQLRPNDPLQHRDLGVSLIQCQEPGPAIDHLHFYLEHAPAAIDAGTVSDVLKQAKTEVAKWN